MSLYFSKGVLDTELEKLYAAQRKKIQAEEKLLEELQNKRWEVCIEVVSKFLDSLKGMCLIYQLPGQHYTNKCVVYKIDGWETVYDLTIGAYGKWAKKRYFKLFSAEGYNLSGVGIRANNLDYSFSIRKKNKEIYPQVIKAESYEFPQFFLEVGKKEYTNDWPNPRSIISEFCEDIYVLPESVFLNIRDLYETVARVTRDFWTENEVQISQKVLLKETIEWTD